MTLGAYRSPRDALPLPPRRASEPDMPLEDPSTTERLRAAQQSDRVAPPWSLRQRCLHVVKDAVLGWSRGRHRAPPRNPFLEYPMPLRHEILQQLLRLRPTGRELLRAAQLLLAAGLPAFDLEHLDDCRLEDVRAVLERLTLTGACLREVALVGQWLYRDGGAPVHRLLRAAPDLRRLRLQEASEAELDAALRHCPRLRRLEVAHPSLRDEHLARLEVEAGSGSALEELVLPSSVGAAGVMRCLRLFPALRYVSCACVDPLLDALDEEPEEEAWWRERTSRVLGLTSTAPLGEESVSMLVRRFPELEELSLEVQEPMELGRLAELPRLRSLELKNSPTLPCSYAGEVLPLLERCGARLVRLSLERFELIDLTRTAERCPGLRAFSAQWFSTLSTAWRPAKGAAGLPELRHLRVRPRTQRRVPQEACELLLTRSPRLRHLEFYGSYGLTDAVVGALLDRGQRFAGLRNLLLRHGHGLSREGIRLLTRAAHHLQVCDVGKIRSKSVA